MKFLIYSAILCCILFSTTSRAQDLLDLIEESETEEDGFTAAIFKGSRLINGHSVKTKKKKELEFVISHRFGTLNSGAREFWGLDETNTRLALEYGLTDVLNIGLGRSSFEKIFDWFLKYKFLRQRTGEKSMPFSAVFFSSMAVSTLEFAPDRDMDFADRTSYTYQVLIARKFTSNFSFQVMPTLIHTNLVTFADDDNDLFSIGAGGRYKITPSVSINLEYYYQVNPNQFQDGTSGRKDFLNSIAVGVDIETGGHVFQLHLTNSRSMVEKGFISETTGDFWDGDIHLGFNITRTFQLGKQGK